MFLRIYWCHWDCINTFKDVQLKICVRKSRLESPFWSDGKISVSISEQYNIEIISSTHCAIYWLIDAVSTENTFKHIKSYDSSQLRIHFVYSTFFNFIDNFSLDNDFSVELNALSSWITTGIFYFHSLSFFFTLRKFSSRFSLYEFLSAKKSLLFSKSDFHLLFH